MGLDISAYRKLRAVGRRSDSEDEWRAGHITFTDNPDFPGRSAGVDCAMAYEDEGEHFSFRAGSYSGYNFWRSWLAGLPGRGAAFEELVWFSDCEGTIGPVVAAKLAKDFAAFDAVAKTNGDEYEYAKYQDWRAAFEMAADNGAVSFH